LNIGVAKDESKTGLEDCIWIVPEKSSVVPDKSVIKMEQFILSFCFKT
jgi:hypothetical protein